MKHYDKSPGVAVVEWRNALHQARPDQYLPLLYVANEVLQNSKRNRGNKFLEAFSPTLGQALVFISQNSNQVERVRRTVKIWGDRHVFSIRYVNEVLKGLEPLRNGGTLPKGSPQAASPAAGTPKFSPMAKSPAALEEPKSSDKDMTRDDSDEGVFQDADDSDEGDLFGDTGDFLLNIDVDFDKAAASANASETASRKRRRSRASTNGAGGSTSRSPSRRRSILSTNSLMELWTQVSTLQQSYDHVQTMLSDITPEYLGETSVESLVGDELLQQYKQVIQYERRVVDQRRELHGVAQKRRALEIEAVRYLPWLEAALHQDQDDIDFCEKLQKQLQSFLPVHAKAKKARDQRVKEEKRRQAEQEELDIKKQEEEERKKFLESAMTKVTEAQPGMVWNKATGEYQYLQTDESWRD